MSTGGEAVEQVILAAKRQGLTFVKLHDGDFALRLELPPAGAGTDIAIGVSSDPLTDHVIHSPMVGYFRRRVDHPSEGAEVVAATTIAVIEALGLPNDIHAGVSGVLDEILVEDGEGVEYGQAVARIARGRA
jgi:acetyl-CoA carboxylase biotin carboxyl carrier protein